MELAFLAFIPYENVIGKDTTMNIRKTLQSGTTAINASLDHPEIKPAISFGNYGWYGKALVEHTVGTSQWSVSLTNHDCIRLAAALIVAERRAKRAENRSRSENKPLPTADSFKRRLDEAIALIETDFPDPSSHLDDKVLPLFAK